MTGKELLHHPFINRHEMARFMYPETIDYARLLDEKLGCVKNQFFDHADDAKAIEVFGLLLRAFMQHACDDDIIPQMPWSEN